MKKFLRRAIVLLLLLLAVVGALLLCKDAFLRKFAESRIQQKTGLVTHIGELKLPLGTATIAVRDFRLMNPPGFGTNALIEVPELFVQLDPDDAASGRLRFREIRFHLKELNVVRAFDKRLNLDVIGEQLEEHLDASLATNAPALTNLAAAGLTFGGIDKLQLTLGRLRYTDQAHPHKSRDVRFDLENETATNLRTAEDVTNWVATFIFRLAMQGLYGADASPNRPLPELILEGPATNRAAAPVRSGP
jgi:hypothetical protein